MTKSTIFEDMLSTVAKKGLYVRKELQSESKENELLFWKAAKANNLFQVKPVSRHLLNLRSFDLFLKTPKQRRNFLTSVDPPHSVFSVELLSQRSLVVPFEAENGDTTWLFCLLFVKGGTFEPQHDVVFSFIKVESLDLWRMQRLEHYRVIMHELKYSEDQEAETSQNISLTQILHEYLKLIAAQGPSCVGKLQQPISDSIISMHLLSKSLS